MTTSFSDAKGRKVVDTKSAETVGKVDGFVVDPASRTIVAIEVKKADAGDTIVWSSIAGFGADAVTIAGEDKITEPTAQVEALLGKDHEILGKRLLTTDGVEVGKVKDVEFDPATGAITSIVLKQTSFEGRLLLGIGSYAVVVSEN